MIMKYDLMYFLSNANSNQFINDERDHDVRKVGNLFTLNNFSEQKYKEKCIFDL